MEADHRAKVHWIEATEGDIKPIYAFSGEPWSIWIAGRKLCQDIKAQVYEAVHAPKIKQYWTGRKRPRMSSDQYDTIDWKATHKAMKATKLSRRIWITKHTTGVCSVGRNAKRWRLRDTDKCPRCGAANETSAHVWLCKAPEAIKQWDISVKRLTDTLHKLHTHSAVIDAIQRRLHEWKTGKPFTPITSTFPGLQDTVARQDEIGWQHFLEGALVLGWQDVQAIYYESIKSRRTSLRWISALIRKLWEVAWDQWEHRNGILHGNENFVTLDEVESIELQVRREFDTGRGPLPTTDSHLFKGTVDRIIKQPLSYKRKWLHHVEVARNRHHRRVQASWPKERIIMRRWLRLNIHK